jgi:hypothetical protein
LKLIVLNASPHLQFEKITEYDGKMQQKLKMPNKIILFLIIYCMYAFIACDQNIDGSIGYGKEIFTAKCISCHNYKEVSVSQVSLFDMSNFDSTNLYRKLKKIDVDEMHKHYIGNTKFSTHEIQSLLMFIKGFSTPPPQ